jgi:GT2 family glycosyltransferase
MNYGIYNKKIFREIGMYRNEFKYYYADGDMTRRAHLFGYKHKTLKNIKVCSLEVEKKAIQSNDYGVYETCHQEYKNKFLNPNIEFLK